MQHGLRRTFQITLRLLMAAVTGIAGAFAVGRLCPVMGSAIGCLTVAMVLTYVGPRSRKHLVQIAAFAALLILLSLGAYHGESTSVGISQMDIEFTTIRLGQPKPWFAYQYRELVGPTSRLPFSPRCWVKLPEMILAIAAAFAGAAAINLVWAVAFPSQSTVAWEYWLGLSTIALASGVFVAVTWIRPFADDSANRFLCFALLALPAAVVLAVTWRSASFSYVIAGSVTAGLACWWTARLLGHKGIGYDTVDAMEDLGAFAAFAALISSPAVCATAIRRFLTRTRKSGDVGSGLDL